MADVRLIDANALKAKIYSLLKIEEAPPSFIEGLETALAVADVAPTISAVPVVHGRWKYSFGSYSTPKCSCCGWNIPYSEDSRLDARNFCPNCGAKMDGGAVDG